MQKCVKFTILGDRLIVGHVPLEDAILVRIQVSQQLTNIVFYAILLTESGVAPYVLLKKEGGKL